MKMLDKTINNHLSDFGENRGGLIILLNGPSNSGKTTLAKELLKLESMSLCICRSMIT